MNKYIVNMKYLHSCVVGLYFHGGSLIENKNTSGISHLLEHLIFRRLESMKIKELYNKLNEIGFTLHGFTSEKLIGFYIQTTPERVEEATEVLLKILSVYYWTEDEIKVEKQIVMRQIDENLQYYFEEKVNRKYYKDTPFSRTIMGKKEYIERLHINKINKYKDKIFCCNNAAIIITGNFSKESEMSIIKKIDIVASRDKRKAIYDDRKNLQIPKRFGKRTKKDDLFVECGSELCDVNISFDVLNQYNTYAVDLLMDILVNGDGAKLSWKLKDTNAWVGDIFGSKECFKDFTRIKIEYSVLEENLIQSLQCFTKTIQNARNKLSEKEKKSVIEFYRFQPELTDDPRTYNCYIAETTFACGRPKFKVKDIIQEYENITSYELKQLANNIFNSNNMFISIGYNGDVIKKSLLKKTCRKMRKILEKTR